jgi:hypothetical protein
VDSRPGTLEACRRRRHARSEKVDLQGPRLRWSKNGSAESGTKFAQLIEVSGLVREALGNGKANGNR